MYLCIYLFSLFIYLGSFVIQHWDWSIPARENSENSEHSLVDKVLMQSAGGVLSALKFTSIVVGHTAYYKSPCSLNDFLNGGPDTLWLFKKPRVFP